MFNRSRVHGDRKLAFLARASAAGLPSLAARSAPYCRHARPPKSDPRAALESVAARTCSRSTSISRRCSIRLWSSEAARLRRGAAGAHSRAAAPESHPRGMTGAAATVEFAERSARTRRPQSPRARRRGRRTGRRGRKNPKAAALPRSSPNTSPRATSRRRSRNSSRAFGRMSATRCCSASPARARPSPWRR